MSFVYVIDKSKFADTTGQKRGLMSLEAFKAHVRLTNTKFADNPMALEEYVREVMEHPVTSDELKASRDAEKKQPTNFAELWEEFAPLIPLYKRTNVNGQSQLFFVGTNNEVAKIDYTDNDALIDALMHRKETFKAIREHYNTSDSLENVRGKLSLKMFLQKIITEHMFTDERRLLEVEPMQISWEPDDYAYKKMDIDQLQPGPTPTWDEFTSRLDHPSVFMAWVWSIFEPTNNIRQVMWLRGAGNDGKSSVQKAIEQVIGRDYCYSMKPGDEDQQWFQKNVFGKVMVNYADCRTAYLIDKNNIKQLTGGDTTSIEGKGENSFTGKIYSKLLVTSNFYPKINPDMQASTSRLIKLEVYPQAEAKKDAGFEARLQSEIYAFLYKCQVAFDTLISSGYDRLVLPPELVEKIRVDCASETYLNVQDFVQDFIEFGESQFCNPADLKRFSKNYFANEKRLTNEQIKYHVAELENKLLMHNCSLSRTGHEGNQVTMWRGFRIKPHAKLKAVN